MPVLPNHATDERAEDDGLPNPRRFWATATLILGIGMTVTDGAIANVALPAIATHLHASVASSIWVINAYALAMMVLLLPFASLGEIVGYRLVSLAGLGLFTAASLGCALSTSLPMLVAARVVQGIGASATLSVNSAQARHIFPRAKLGRGIGLLSLSVGIAASAAPSLASAILAVADWPWLFAVNVPIGVVTVALARRTLPANPLGSHRFDGLSAVLSALTFGLLVVALDSVGHPGRRLAGAITLLVAVGCGVWLVRRQNRRAAPLLPVDLLRIPAFALAIATSICSYVAQAMVFVAMPFTLQYGLGRSQVATGLLMTPWPALAGLLAPITGRLADRVSTGLLCGLGLAVMGGATLLLALLPAHPQNWRIAGLMGLCGVGFGLFQSPNNRAMLGAAPRHRSGGASGMLGTARTFGQSLGAAAVAVVFGLWGNGAGGVALAIAAAIAALAAVVSVSRVAIRRQMTDDR